MTTLSVTSRRTAFTLVEMLTTIAVLVIVLGLMVSLARHVRQSSATLLTRGVLTKLDRLMEEYVKSQGALPPVNMLKDAGFPAFHTSEAQLLRNARINNEQFVRCLRSQFDLSSKLFGGAAVSFYDETTLRDAWGSPIVLMTSDDKAFGIRPPDRSYFFFSAGPDRNYKTTEDNIYSYDLPASNR